MISAEHVALFEAERPRLQALAYRMLGSVADADDAVQDGWLRWHQLGEPARAEVVKPAAWLTTVVSRVALDRLKSAQRQREEYVGPWLPDPVLDAPGPDDSAELAESLTLGFLTVLERLGPVERAVFLLVDVFGEPYDVVAEVVGRSPGACRQVATRARRRVRAERQRAGATLDRSEEHADALVGAFLAACLQGDLEGLHRVLADDVVLVSDGGAHAHAARRPVLGFDRVARLVTNLAKRLPEGLVPELRTVNGEPGLVGWIDGVAVLVLVFEPHRERITAVRIVVNPDKLRHLTPVGGAEQGCR